MDVDPVLTGYYRYMFRDFLQRKSDEAELRRRTGSSGVVVADVFQFSDAPKISSPEAPQGLGENKHFLDGENPEPENYPYVENVREIEEREDSWDSESAYKYMVGASYGVPIDLRREMESEVRRVKMARMPCPHRDKNGVCSTLFIRCGDRKQFDFPETREEKNMPHHCHYNPGVVSRYILIVDDDRRVREFCKNAFELFFQYDGEKIVTAESAEKAVEKLNMFKKSEKLCGLAVIDTALPGMTGFELVNEIFERNFNVEVVLLEEEERRVHKPEGYLGDTEVFNHRPFVKKVITKPFHSETFVNSIREMALDALSVSDRAY